MTPAKPGGSNPTAGQGPDIPEGTSNSKFGVTRARHSGSWRLREVRMSNASPFFSCPWILLSPHEFVVQPIWSSHGETKLEIEPEGRAHSRSSSPPPQKKKFREQSKQRSTELDQSQLLADGSKRQTALPTEKAGYVCLDLAQVFAK